MGEAVTPTIEPRNAPLAYFSGFQCDWVLVVEDAKNPSATPTLPATIIANEAGNHPVKIGARGTTVMVANAYTGGPADVIVKAYGSAQPRTQHRDTGSSLTVAELIANRLWQPLTDKDGNISVTISGDPDDPTSADGILMTKPVEFDTAGCALIVIVVSAGSAGTTSQLYAKVR